MTDTFRPPILVHNCCCSREDVGSVFLRPDIQNERNASGYQDNAGNRRGLDGLLPVCHLLPGLAAMVQLDSVRANDQLSSHVCTLQRD